MTARPPRPLPIACLLVLAASVLGAHVRAQSDADLRRFPKLARLLLVPEEEALLKKLKSDQDRLEFEKVFWARRDPTPLTAANEFEDSVRAAWAKADKFFATPNQRGAETGCGQVLALLGPPDVVEGLETEVQFDNLQAAREGPRRAETWTYRNRPGQIFSSAQAQLKIAFDTECRFGEGGLVLQDLRRIAAAKIVRPDVDYRKGADGHLLPLPTAAASDSAVALLFASRSDFPLSLEPKLVARAPGGEGFVAGLARLSPGLPAGTDAVRVQVAARATEAEGGTSSAAAREALAPVAADGSIVVSFGLSLKPGKHAVKVAVLLADSDRGATGALEVDVPDFGGGALVATPLVVYPEEAAPPPAGPPDAHDPYAAFRLGTMRIRPRFGNAYSRKDSILVVATVYGAAAAPSGQAALKARYTILKNGKPVARGQEDVFTTRDSAPSVGPIPLASFEPGAYVVRLDLDDTVAGQTLQEECPLAVLPE
jgi:GWxTD domain-containing protein